MAADDQSPWNEEGDAFTVTIKASKDYGAPWIVVRAGTREQLRARLSLLIEDGTVEELDDLSIPHLISRVSTDFERAFAIRNQLGAVQIKDTPVSAPQQPATAPSSASQQASGGQATPEDSGPLKAIEAELAAAQSMADVKTVYAKHAEAWKSSEAVKAAFKKRSQELTAK